MMLATNFQMVRIYTYKLSKTCMVIFKIKMNVTYVIFSILLNITIYVILSILQIFALYLHIYTFVYAYKANMPKCW